MKKILKNKWFLWSFLGILILFGTFVYYRYYFIYSEGTRVGILYKFSKRGTMYKTYEGEMVLPGFRFQQSNSGPTSNLFYFSVEDEELAKKLEKTQGMEVEIHYKQYHGVLPWRGDKYEGQNGQYIVDKLIRIKNENPNGYGL